ncbi:MAG: SMC-Scp complex subunit ScpB [Patescibacteria group bacterium]
MTELSAKIEAILFVSSKPISMKFLANACSCQIDEATAAVDELALMRNAEDSGIHVVIGDEGITLATNPSFASTIENLSKEDIESELTRPSLETLTIVAYRGPITKPEIEAIRGINCTLILRNLLMRGLVDENEDAVKLQPVYSLTNDALRYLGLHNVNELADYADLHGNTKIDALLSALTTESSDV